ncbi:MAG: hypothetical protein NWS47_03905 [Alphaproteobacteria bacterium]|nr:hypothetical protein [Alphaproteobacteria bacterium]
MKKISAFFLCLHVAYAMEPFEPKNKLPEAFKAAFKVSYADIKGDDLYVKGTQEQLDRVVDALIDFNRLRDYFLPPSTNVINVRASSVKLESWGACFDALCIDSQEVRLTNMDAAQDTTSELRIPIDTGFNRGIARLYVDLLKEKSSFFNWAYTNIKEFVREDDNQLIISYGLLNDFLYSAIGNGVTKFEAGEEGVDERECYELTIPVQSILKRLIAASSGVVTLRENGNGTYKAYTTSLGNELSYGKVSRISAEFLLDKSGSMGGESINKLNQEMPKLLTMIRDLLPENTICDVIISPFTDKISKSEIRKFSLEKGKSIPSWGALVADGGTDLTHIGNAMALKAEEDEKIVVAYTDGNHESQASLPSSLDMITKLQKSGHFARPYFRKIGATAQSDFYLNETAIKLAGSFDNNSTMNAFFDQISIHVKDLLRAKMRIVFTIDGAEISFHQPNHQLGLYEINPAVSEGDSFIHSGITTMVDRTTMLPQPSEIIGLRDVGGLTFEEEKDSEETNTAAVVLGAMTDEQIDELTSPQLQAGLITELTSLSPEEQRAIAKQIKKQKKTLCVIS